MRIDAYNQVAQLYSANRVSQPRKPQPVQPAYVPQDGFQISQMGRDYQTARTAVANAPDVREDVVAIAKQNLASGKYDNLSGANFADKLLEKYEAARALA
jgi:negative regulator of flagellin synthesis FlgM